MLLPDTSQVQPEFVAIKTVFVLYEQKYFQEETLERTKLRFPKDGWAWAGLQRLAKISSANPIGKSQSNLLKDALSLAGELESWRGLTATNTDKLTRTWVLDQFTALELELQRCDISDGQKYKYSTVLRKFAFDGIKLFNEVVAKTARSTFRTKLKSNRNSRPLISQIKGVDKNGLPRLPVDALPFTTIQELRKDQQLHLNAELDNIRNACMKELIVYETVCKEIKLNLNHVPDTEILKKLQHLVLYTNHDTFPKWIDEEEAEPKNLGGTYLRIIESIPNEFPDESLQLNFVRVKSIREWMINVGHIGTDTPKNIFLYLMFGDRFLRSACLLGLLRHTGWNSSAVASLTIERVIGESPPYQLQGYKSKVSKNTPVIVIEKSDDLECQIIEFLKKRLNWLKRLGWVEKNETRLWINPTKAREDSERAKTYVSFRMDVKLFQNKYQLPSFSLDQIRTQVMAASHVSGISLDTTRANAGHTAIDTTSGYLEQNLIKTLNTAINLEYQRRLERSIDYEILLKAGQQERNLDKSLLFPIGDGASCTQPNSPPDPKYLKDGICDGRGCHVGEGCPNRKLVINSLRVEENVRQVIFYQQNWKILSEYYPNAFAKYHLPAMTFSIALEALIKDGPLGHVQAAIKQAITKSMSQNK